MLRIAFEGSNPVEPKGQRAAGHGTNFLLGNDPAKWRIAVRSFSEVVYEQLYEGIDLTYRAGPEGPKYEFNLAPGADPASIRIRVSGGALVELDASGALRIQTSAGDLVDSPPISRQGDALQACAFQVRDASSYGFACSGVDPTLPLVIDPVVYAAYWGGTSVDYGWKVKAGPNGTAYLMGGTNSFDFPTTPGALNESQPGGEDYLISLLNANGTALVYSTYLGGTGDENVGGGANIAVAPDGGVYFVGLTNSSDFPTTAGAYRVNHSGGFNDGVIAKLNASGASIDFGTYLGGSQGDHINDVVLSASGEVFVVGETRSGDFPTTPEATGSCGRGEFDVVLAGLSVDLTTLLFSRCFGGAGWDDAWSVAVGPDGLLYFCGDTTSSNLPVTADAYNLSYGGTGPFGYGDAYFGVFSPATKTVTYATFLGRENDEIGFGIGVDGSGEIYLAGGTNSSDFPVTAGSLDQEFASGGASLQNLDFGELFVTKFVPGGRQINWSTFVGGNGYEGFSVDSFALDARGNVYIGGLTGSADFPTTTGAMDPTFKGPEDPFFLKLNATGKGLSYSSFLRSEILPEYWAPGGLDVDTLGDVYVTPDVTVGHIRGAPATLNLSSSSEDAAIIKIRLGSPEGLSAEPLGGNLRLSWLPPQDISVVPVTGYRIYRGNGSDPEALHRSTSNNDTTLMDYYYFSGSTYCFQISAVTQRGESERSEELCLLFASPPTAPQNVNAVPGNRSVLLNWTPPAVSGGAPILGYIVRGGDNDVALSVRTMTNGTTLSFSGENLTNGVTYFYQVTAFNYLFTGASSSVVSATPAGIPDAPSGLSATVGNVMVRLSWSAPQYAGDVPLLGYDLYRNATNGTFELIAFVSNATASVDATVINGLNYTYQVRAKNHVWEGAGTPNVTAKPMGVPSAPTNLVAIASNRLIQLNWSSPEETGGVPLMGYYLLRGLSLNNLTFYATVPGDASGFLDTNVENGQTYFFAVAAFNEMWNSTNSDVVAATPPVPAPPPPPWSLILLLVAAFAAGTGGLVWWGTRRGGRYARSDALSLDGGSPAGRTGGEAGGAIHDGARVTQIDSSRGSMAVAAAAATAQAAFVALAKPGDRRTYLVENVFLLYRDGRNMFASGALGVDAVEDPELVGSMLVAVQDFIKDSFKKGANVDRMGYGESAILIERGDHVILAVTVFGSPPEAFRELMADTVEKVQGTYAGIIEQWDGNKTALRGIESLLAPIWVPTLDLTHEDILLATTAREVQVRSGVEFFQGFVRLKVSVVNSTTSVITGASIDLDYDHDALRLHKIEPSSYRTEGAKVNLAVINTGEKKTVAYYFDPQICTLSAIDGACRFKDPDGHVHTVQMKSRKAEVVCPLFFTQEQANTAMLKRLVQEELKLYDVKGYSFKAGMAQEDLHSLFEAVKSTVRAHDVVLVRSFEGKQPYVAEAWFYGRTQKGRDPIVIRGVVDSGNARVEFYAASGAIRSVTGLLAEFHHTFDAKVRDEFAGFGITPLFDESLRRVYSDPSVVSQWVEGSGAQGVPPP